MALKLMIKENVYYRGYILGESILGVSVIGRVFYRVFVY